MSKVEIASWVASAANVRKYDEDDDEDDSDEESTSSPQATSLSDEETWRNFMVLARTNVLTSKTKIRTEFINEKLYAIAARGGINGC